MHFTQWAEMKPTMPFGQLPVMDVDGTRYAQSGAMLQYAGQITGMLPRDPTKALRVNEAVGLDDDLRNKIRPSIYVGMDKTLSERTKKAKVKEMRAEILKTHIPYYLGHFEKMLEKSEYLAGDKPTIADAQFLSTVRWLTSGTLDHIPETCTDDFPKVKALREKMEAHPAVAEYLESLKKK